MSSGGGSLLCGAGRGSGRGICGSAYSGRGDELRLEKREPAGGDLSPAGFGLEQPLQSSCEGVQIDGGGEPQGAGVSAIRPDGQGPVGPAAAKGDGDSVNGNFPGGGVVGIISGRVFVPRSHPESHVLGVAGAADLCGVPAQSGVVRSGWTGKGTSSGSGTEKPTSSLSSSAEEADWIWNPPLETEPVGGVDVWRESARKIPAVSMRARHAAGSMARQTECRGDREASVRSRCRMRSWASVSRARLSSFIWAAQERASSRASEIMSHFCRYSSRSCRSLRFSSSRDWMRSWYWRAAPSAWASFSNKFLGKHLLFGKRCIERHCPSGIPKDLFSADPNAQMIPPVVFIEIDFFAAGCTPQVCFFFR